MKEAVLTKGMKIITGQENIQIIPDIIIHRGLPQDTIHREVTVHQTEALHLRLDLPAAAEEAVAAEAAVQAGDN